MGGLEPVPDHDVASVRRRSERDDAVADVTERRQEAREPSPVLVSSPTSVAEFAEVLVDEVVGDARRHRIGVAGGERRQIPLDDLGTTVHLRDGPGVDLWSNDVVAHDDADDDADDGARGASPWERDDWVPDSAVPDATVFGADRARIPGSSRAASVGGAPGEPPPEAFADPEDDERRSSSTFARKAIAAGIVIALVVGSAGALLRSGDDSETPSPEGTAPPADESPATTEVPAMTTAPSTTQVVTLEAAGVAAAAGGDTGALPAFEVGRIPSWAERSILVPEPLGAIAPTEVIALSQSDVLSVTEFPTGRSRSIDVAGLGPGLQLAVGDGTIVVFNSTNVMQIRDGEPVVVSSVPDGIIFLEPWTGTDQFIVTTPATGPSTPEQELVLRADGSLVALDERLAEEVRFWSRSFSPAGDTLLTRPGGVYAVAPDGVARRISTGDLLATGDAHWAIEECDESLRCAYSVIAWDTGAVTPGVLDVIESFGFIDPATRISPDGKSIVYRSDTDGSGQRRLLDVATGETFDAGRINQLRYSDAWATDSSGIFISDRVVEFIDRRSRLRTPIDDLGRVRAVATGPFSSFG